ncbi:MAG TPA: cyclic lactone autoinducer peptide [Syntrophomonadaceae bacterium]|nr:cyclic lactone autoinducer peptide [Syntrophomonadaceae bacterium]
MKKLMYRFSGFLVIALSAVAQVSPQCWFFHYQSEVPTSLRK